MVSKGGGLQSLVRKAQESNTHSYKFYKQNEEWLLGEVNEYLEQNQKEMEQKREEEERDEKEGIENEVRNYLYNENSE